MCSYLDTHPRPYFRTFVASMILHHMEVSDSSSDKDDGIPLHDLCIYIL